MTNQPNVDGDSSADSSVGTGAKAKADGSRRTNRSETIEFRARDLLLAFVLMFVADLTIFRAEGLAGPAMMLFTSAIALAFAVRPSKRQLLLWPTVGLLTAMAIRIAWNGSVVGLFCGVILTLAAGLVAAGGRPLLLEALLFGLRIVGDGAARLCTWILPGNDGSFARKPVALGVDPASLQASTPGSPQVSAPGSKRRNPIVLPLLATLVFGGIFVMANPNLADIISTKLQFVSDRFWLFFNALSVWEIPFCIFALLIAAGLLCPLHPRFLFGPRREKPVESYAHFKSGNFTSFRNTLGVLTIPICGVPML